MTRPPRPHPSSREAIAMRMKIIRRAWCGDDRGAITRFSNLVGIAQTTWVNYEQGTNQISVEFALQLCERAEVGLNYIYRGAISDMTPDMRRKIENLPSE